MDVDGFFFFSLTDSLYSVSFRIGSGEILAQLIIALNSRDPHHNHNPISHLWPLPIATWEPMEERGSYERCALYIVSGSCRHCFAVMQLKV